ncbi:hypothetical protein [Teredinibacter franksiae]|uniref:hypothetical protein n=1 Tax=Teredinibacter franksiae TaxID=2761453 RepID=UPI00162964AB|nr:hypothetical protein [Teredinibacter franksiae]
MKRFKQAMKDIAKNRGFQSKETILESYVVPLPRRMTLESTIQFANDLHSLPKALEYVLDFQHVGRIEPYSLLFLSSEIQRCRERYSECKFLVMNHQSKTYAAHMGFFKAFGCDFGKDPGEASGSARYLPINIWSADRLREKAAENYEAVGEFIEREAEKMSGILTQSDSGDLFDTLTYSIREVIRNVVEHSEASQFGFCAQYWPSYGKVELALLDRGIGVREGLSSNPHLKIESDHEALNCALMPGISGKAFKGVRRDKNDVWANSGFGLYMTSRLCREGGSFFIASGETGLYLSENKKRNLNTPFKGTALRLVLNTERLSSLSSMLSKYRKDASEFKNTYSEKNNIAASTASKMLRRDFKKS